MSKGYLFDNGDELIVRADSVVLVAGDDTKIKNLSAVTDGVTPLYEIDTGVFVEPCAEDDDYFYFILLTPGTNNCPVISTKIKKSDGTVTTVSKTIAYAT